MGYRDALKAWSSRNRLLLFISAFVIFLIGLALSFNHLDLGQRDLTYISLLFVLIITQPILIILNSAELKLCASASKSQMSFRDSLYVSSSATVANILPLPAGLILRGAALVKGGATATMSAKILMIAALMWVAVALTFSGAAILGPANFYNAHTYLMFYPRNDLLIKFDVNAYWRLEQEDGVYGPPGNIILRPGQSNSKNVNLSYSAAIEWTMNEKVNSTFLLTYSKARAFLHESGLDDNTLFMEYTLNWKIF